ncbi:hypothetical protein ACO0RG_002094 [Hanseniaspora osmophila]
MSGKFVRASKFRHVFGEKAKKELQYENLKVTSNAWDSNVIKTNGKYIACNWNASGGGAFAIIPTKEVGKLPDKLPLFRGHTAAILDTDFDPFDEQKIASASDDAKICIWEIPENFTLQSVDNAEEVDDIEKPVQVLTGHSRKVGHILYHPIAKDVLASSSMDRTVRIWNVATGKDEIVLKHPDMVTSMCFNYNGEYLATVAKDKKIRVWDLKTQELVSEGHGHDGAKNQRLVWLGNSDRLATTGFSKLSDRQIGVWDAFNLEKGDLGGFYTVDQSSGILMPFYDDSTNILYLAGKGDGNIRYFEFLNDELFELSEFNSTDPQRGFAMAPKRTVNVHNNQIMQAYKTVNDRLIEPISFICPRKAEVFQNDIYPDAPSDKPALTAEEWFNGDKASVGPVLFNFQAVYDGTEPSFSSSIPTDSASKQVKKEPKTETKEVPKEAPKEQAPKEQAPKEQAPKEQAPKSKQSFPEATHVKSPSPSQPVDEVLKSDDGVNKLLSRAATLDDMNDAENPSKETSEWEPETPKKKEAEPIKINGTAKSENKKSALEDKTPVKSTLLKEEEKAKGEKASAVEEKPKVATTEKKKEATPYPAANPPSATSATASPSKSMGLKQSVEKLSSLVLQLESVIGSLIESNLEKDERLAQLESKIEQLLSK